MLDEVGMKGLRSRVSHMRRGHVATHFARETSSSFSFGFKLKQLAEGYIVLTCFHFVIVRY
jgi:hypothetical protein